MGRQPGARGRRHYHVVRRPDGGGADQVGPMMTLAEAWADVRRRAAIAPADFWRVAVCQRGCQHMRREALSSNTPPLDGPAR